MVPAVLLRTATTSVTDARVGVTTANYENRTQYCARANLGRARDSKSGPALLPHSSDGLSVPRPLGIRPLTHNLLIELATTTLLPDLLTA